MLLSCVLVLCLALAGCGSESSGDKIGSVPENTLTLGVRMDRTSDKAQALLEQTLAEYIDAFRKTQPKTDVKVIYYAELPRDLNGLDCVIMGADDMLLYADNMLADMSGCPAIAGVSEDQLIRSTLKAGRLDGDESDLLLLAFNYDHAVVLADNDLIGLFNATLPADGNWNLTGFTELLEACTDRVEKVQYSGIYMPYYMPHVWQFFCRAEAGGYLTDTGRFDFSGDEKLYNAMDRLFMLYKHNNAYSRNMNAAVRTCAMSWTFACDPDANVIAYEPEHILVRNPATNLDDIMARNALTLLPLPLSDSGERIGIMNTDFIRGFSVPKSSGKQEAAQKFAAFSLTAEGQEILHRYFGGIPVNKTVWSSGFWRTGVFAGDNGDRALVGVDNGFRNDFTDALVGDPNVYNKNVRMRTVFSAVMYREFGSSKNEKNFFAQLDAFCFDANRTKTGLISSYSR